MALDNVFVNYTSGVDDPGNGAIGSPVKTINYGIGLVNPDGNVWLRGGTHTTTTYIGNNIPSGSSTSSHTTIQNYDDEDVVIQRDAEGDTNPLILISTGGGTARSHITITGSVNHPIVLNGGSLKAGGGVYFQTPGGIGYHDDIILDYLTITACDNSGINTGTLRNGRFRNMYIHDGGNHANLDHGIYVNNNINCIFEYIEVDAWAAYGIQIYGSGSISGNIIRYCNAHHNGSYGLGIFAGSNNSIQYCHSWLNTSGGIILDSNNSSALNNVSYKNGSSGSSTYNIQIFPGHSSCTVKNNISLQGFRGNFLDGGSGNTVSNNVGFGGVDDSGTGTNYWTDPDAGDFSLKNTAGTPSTQVTNNVIDQGAAVGLSEDSQGTAVPQGAWVDIGATEWGSDPPDAPIATHDPAYIVSAIYGDVTVTLVKGTNNIVECTLSGTGAAALCVDNTNVTVVRN